MMKPQVSVLLCVYNPEIPQLQKSVNSIICQTYTDWEIILYDDGSYPLIAEDIKNLSYSDERIAYIRNNEHKGLAFGLNASIEKSQGQYLARMDADDISVPARLEKQLEFLDIHKEFQYVGCSVELIDINDSTYGIRRFPECPGKRDFLNFSPYAHPALMFRRECLIRNGGYIRDEGLLRGEDYELLMRLHSKGYSGYNIKEPLLKYRESISKKIKHSLPIQVNEMKIRYKGFKQLGILNFFTLPYVLKPLAVWAAPGFVIRKARHATIDRKTADEQ